MSDEADEAAKISELYLRHALQKRKPVSIIPTGIGRCLHCAKPVKKERRWCDAFCRDAWEKENA